MVEPASGTILVDGVDIRQLSLTQLRARLTIIPQEPVLFSGTLRFNLDPEGKLSDAAIWAALEAVNSRGFVAKLADKLDTAVQDFGENFSLGQRQLICLARAILRKSPVVLLDEPTASMDLETDEMVQEAIRRCFRDSTVISISHRLGGIEAYDRVMVMDSGRIVEFDEPAVLLADPASLLSQMVAEYSQF
jgi:ABC-type multidrug transport system fused ATPase/permease subunit